MKINISIHESGGAGFVQLGAMIGVAGAILSGPPGTLISWMIKPAPEWSTAQNFAANYTMVHDLPFLFGFLLVGAMLILMAGQYLSAREEGKGRALMALILTAVFTTLIVFNYIVQTTFVRDLAMHYKSEYESAITTFSMSNPHSLAWSIEMWGYAVLGAATWVLAGNYKARNRAVWFFLIANGIGSILSALLTMIALEWVLTLAGFIFYCIWNVLVVMMLILIYRDAKNGSVSEISIR
jgi:hypothetical protein